MWHNRRQVTAGTVQTYGRLIRCWRVHAAVDGLIPLGRSEFESAAAVMAGALNAVGAEVSGEVAVMVDEVISPL